MANDIVGPAAPPEIRQMADGVQMAAAALQNASLESSVGIDAITQQITEQNKISQDNKTDRDRNQLLMDLVLSTEKGDEEGKNNSLALRSEFKASNQRLQAAIESGDQEVIDLERESQDTILANAETEENRREANKVNEKQSKLLGKISSGIGGLVGFAKDNAIIAGGGVFAALALFNPELMEKIVNKLVETLTAAMKIVKALMNGDIEGALEAFKSEWKMFTGAFIFFFGGKIAKVLMAAHKVFKGLMVAAQTYKLFLATEYAGSMIAHFKAMGRALGGKLMKVVRGVTAAATAFRVMFMMTVAPAMIAAFTGILASMTAALLPLLPAIGIGLAIAAVVALIGFGLVKLRDALGFDSVFDLIFLGAAFLQDGFAHIANVFIRLAKKIAGMGTKLLEFMGFEVPDFVKKIANAELMSTDNAARKKTELQQKKIDKDNEEFEKTELGKSVNTTGDELDMSSMDNKMEGQFLNQAAAAPVVINQKQGDVITNTSNTAVRSYRRPRSWRSDDISSSYS